LVIDRGSVVFRDAAVKGATPIQIDVGSLEVSGGGFGGAGFEGRSAIAAQLEVEGAPLHIDADLGPVEGGWETKVRFDGKGLPIQHAVAYSPYGWEDLKGRLDVAGEWEGRPQGTRVKGRAALRDVAVRTRGAQASGTEWPALEVEADEIDLSKHEA